MRILTTLLSILLFCQNLEAAAFGLRAGMGREEIEAMTGPLQEVSPSVFLATELPGGYPEIQTYSLFITPEHGLCRIQGTSEVIPSDGQGEPLRERFDRLMERLWEAHGYPEVIDRLTEGSDWSGEGEWMIALYERERILMTLWTQVQGAQLPEGVERVTLAARALKANEGFLALDYTLSNWTRCQVRFDDPETYTR